MRLVVGLGNPGEEYEGTRHNVGFEAIDRLAVRRGLAFERMKASWVSKTLGLWAVDKQRGIALLKPQTYMNRSGEAVVEAVNRLGIPLEGISGAILAVSDDFALPVGQIRIRSSGSSGGQKGLQSLIDHLHSDGFPRLRIGIGDPKGQAADFVLSRFSKSERVEIDECLERSAAALEQWLNDGDLQRCMNEFNKKQ